MKNQIKVTEQRTPKKKCRTEKLNKEINKSMKPDRAYQKPKGKERTFETQITIEP